ncbi:MULTISPECIES: iron-containing redox enzyme family protein [unclassified Pseudomonas]|uniref:iron-containing redox enzyme family protein n=1 Tax=unclassified Pseudomonas TaxID=196821 RepID=UPI0009D79BEC|nr:MULTISPECIES: iron-containing redox enzyme family protein [Pseudomonas]SMC92067.1 Iron-containing redox enzyme [Pseudomonas sp. URIL14HWK12:I5]SNS87669.1 Iron-containing redox enzyme [Pseudomonas sp. LAMO17WK12:I8]SNY18751.1 Iron-containing redox enzyme [Pseudomonas sp. LAMO17WK12:I12]SNY18845.1 Iron-containing redox enzyme [Pseudomonas sp. LAMO17WK12:I11]SNY18868.1 Iron-containing redox enzyme [Pseudomonas sp. LAMO17WK12:I7]
MVATTKAGIRPHNANLGLEHRYRALLEGPEPTTEAWLEEQLRLARALSDDLPDDPGLIPQWADNHAGRVASEHAAYLEQRRQGGPRRFFANHAHALWFLQQVAPTKAVDGAWLHGALRHWQDPRFHGLIRTFLEELGDGDPRCNHVLIYQRLLSRLGCSQERPLDPARYLQGALQLALGQHCQRFLPEVVGYNLGYEQPPLHLLITTHELAELGIDAHYFQLHVTIDNAASGHARRAVECFTELARDQGPAFYERVRHGYRLNDLGIDTPSLIASFDLHAELLSTLERKRIYGQCMHSDRCRLQGRTINQWLAEPGAMPGFLEALQAQGWIKRDSDPGQSRFWSLIEGPTAAMFGVFDAYEKQLWHDWIAGSWQGTGIRRVPPGQWEHALQLDDKVPIASQVPDIPALIDAMAGNRHATPQGLHATHAFIQATGLMNGGLH